MNTEIWKSITGYEGLYEVSNLGRVKSLKFGKERIIKPWKDKKGYLRVNLYRNGKMKYFLVHRLVATAFIPNPFGFTEINHRDENPSNNVESNIEWCSKWYNINYGTRTARAAVSLTNHPAKSKPVEASKYEDFRTIELRFASTREAGRNGYDQGHVADCCRGCYSTHKGNFYKNLYWRFAS